MYCARYTLNYLDVYFNNINLNFDGSYQRFGGTRCHHIQGSLIILNSLALLLKSCCFAFVFTLVYCSKVEVIIYFYVMYCGLASLLFPFCIWKDIQSSLAFHGIRLQAPWERRKSANNWQPPLKKEIVLVFFSVSLPEKLWWELLLFALISLNIM